MNGYTNEDTYGAALVFDNYEHIYDEMRKKSSRYDAEDMDDVATFADDLKDMVEDYPEFKAEKVDPDEVNYEELARDYLED